MDFQKLQFLALTQSPFVKCPVRVHAKYGVTKLNRQCDDYHFSGSLFPNALPIRDSRTWPWKEENWTARFYPSPDLIFTFILRPWTKTCFQYRTNKLLAITQLWTIIRKMNLELIHSLDVSFQISLTKYRLNDYTAFTPRNHLQCIFAGLNDEILYQ